MGVGEGLGEGDGEGLGEIAGDVTGVVVFATGSEQLVTRQAETKRNRSEEGFLVKALFI